MKINQESLHAIKMVEYLANENEIANAGVMSEKLGLTLIFSLKILRLLKVANIIESYRGITGGYKLNKEVVSVYEIIKALQGELYIANNFKNKKEPDDEIDIELKKIQEDVISKLKKIKIKKKS